MLGARRVRGLRVIAVGLLTLVAMAVVVVPASAAPSPDMCYRSACVQFVDWQSVKVCHRNRDFYRPEASAVYDNNKECKTTRSSTRINKITSICIDLSCKDQTFYNPYLRPA